jgi:transcriptional regulator with XRE-family HTH domain
VESISSNKPKVVNDTNIRSRRLLFPNRIGDLRKGIRHRLTQAELASRMGVSERHLRRIEKGDVVPNAIMLRRIAEVLLVAVSDLYLRRNGADG